MTLLAASSQPQPHGPSPVSAPASNAYRQLRSSGMSCRCRNSLWKLVVLLVCASLSLSWASAKNTPPNNANHDRAARSGTSAPTSVPDFSGIWMEREDDAITFTNKEPALQPWAEAKFRAAKPGYGPRATSDSHDPILSCLPPGVPRILLIPFPMQILQTPEEIIMIFEYDHFVRHIALDRHEHPKDLDPSWMGDSIGKWSGDTLVVDTVGFNDKSWLDQVGHPHSDALHLIERIRRVDRDTLQDDITIDDPKAYVRPWTGQQTFKLRPTWHLAEYICEDNMSDPHR
jgi:hypothetical protein